MTNLQRLTGKIFGETATATGDDPQIGQFGSALNGTYVGTTDVATIQGLPAWSNGFIDSVTPNEQFPPLPEMTGFGKVLSYQTAYLLQHGIAEWDSATTYYENNFCSKNGKIYISQTDSNLNNNPESDTVNWHIFESGGGRNIGEIVTSTIPLTDAGLHLLDGTLLSGSGSYSAFVDYIAGLYDSGNYTDIFETEANWQSAVTTYGVCGKFVYDSVDNTVRLPKITGILEGTTDITALGDLVEAGLPNITGTFNAAQDVGSSGVFQTDYTGHVPYARGDWYSYVTSFNASRSSAIYGNSNTVQPQAIKVLYYIVIATTTKTDIQVDIDEIATDLNGKADVDLTNVPSSKGILTESYVNGTSWYRVYSDGWCEQGGRYLIQTSGSGTINFLKTFRDTNYAIFNCKTSSDSSTWNVMFNVTPDWTTSSVTIKVNLTGYQLGGSWMACGYIS